MQLYLFFLRVAVGASWDSPSKAFWVGSIQDSSSHQSHRHGFPCFIREWGLLGLDILYLAIFHAFNS